MPTPPPTSGEIDGVESVWPDVRKVNRVSSSIVDGLNELQHAQNILHMHSVWYC